MAFERQSARTPVAIAGIEIRLFSPDPASARPSSADFSVQVRYSDDSVDAVRGNLVPHLSQGQINALLSFMDDMRTKANTEILPE